MWGESLIQTLFPLYEITCLCVILNCLNHFSSFYYVNMFVVTLYNYIVYTLHWWAKIHEPLNLMIIFYLKCLCARLSSYTV